MDQGLHDPPASATQRNQRSAQRRAPRLGPDQLIAAHITRRGRFSQRDPRKARELPRFTRVAGVVAWAVFVEETFRRARRAERGGAVDGV